MLCKTCRNSVMIHGNSASCRLFTPFAFGKNMEVVYPLMMNVKKCLNFQAVGNLSPGENVPGEVEEKLVGLQPDILK